MSKTGTPWTEEEIEFLKANYNDMFDREIGEILGRSTGGVSHQIRKLKLPRVNHKEWPEEKIQYLKANYGKVPVKEIAERLGCHPDTVHSRASKLGLGLKREKRCPKCGHWTSNDEVRCPNCALWLHTRSDCRNCAEFDGTSCKIFTTRNNPPMNKYGVCHGKKRAPAGSMGPTKLTSRV